MEEYKRRCGELVRRLNEASEAYYNGREEGGTMCRTTG